MQDFAIKNEDEVLVAEEIDFLMASPHPNKFLLGEASQRSQVGGTDRDRFQASYYQLAVVDRLVP